MEPRMRAVLPRSTILPLAFVALCGFSEHAAAPPTIPYMCADGHSASVIYEWGSDYTHARALVTYDGRTTEMRAAPTLYGVRYRAEAADGAPALAWSLRGDEGRLTRSPDAMSYTGDEQELARCARVREGGAGAEAAGHE